MLSRSVLLLSLAISVPTGAARADFKLHEVNPPDGKSVLTTGPGNPMPIPRDTSAADDDEATPPDKPRVPYAQGFGHAVPLSFAARQIVPRNVTIRFGADVDQTAPVDWRGGRPWNLVMGAAVRPLHLHLTFSRTSVLIS